MTKKLEGKHENLEEQTKKLEGQTCKLGRAKKNFATLKLKCVSKTFLLAAFVHFSAGLFGQNQYSCQLKVLRISLEKSPQSPLNIMLLTSEEKNENKFCVKSLKL